MRNVSTEYNLSPEVRRFKERDLPALPAGYTEPGQENSLITPYGAAPAFPFRDDYIKNQQDGIESQYVKLYSTPPTEMPEDFVGIVLDDYVINGQRRQMENYEAYMKYVNGGKPVSDDMLSTILLFEGGHATIDQIADVATHTDIESLEFGKVTHPYGYRMNHIEGLRRDTNAAIESHGGVVYPTISPYRSIAVLPKIERYDDGSDYGLQRIVGFIVKYKRDVGRIPIHDTDEFVHVVERQIAAYRVDEASGFNQEVLVAMHQLSDNFPKRIQWDQPLKPNFLDRLKRTGCQDYIEQAVQQDSLEDFVVPISTTIYGFKGEHPVFGKIGQTEFKSPTTDDTIAFYDSNSSS